MPVARRTEKTREIIATIIRSVCLVLSLMSKRVSSVEFLLSSAIFSSSCLVEIFTFCTCLKLLDNELFPEKNTKQAIYSPAFKPATLSETRKFSCGKLKEAYLPRSKHNLSCGGDTPTCPGWGYPTQYWTGGTPEWVPPWEGVWNFYEMEMRPPPPQKKGGPVKVLWNGDVVPPQKGHGTSGSTMGWKWGTSCKGHVTAFPLLTDRHLWKHNLPPYYLCGQ